ncbi:hypothetical protein M405DRAFT_493616, partial [Rhizopogon salebrosus TDB-379]
MHRRIKRKSNLDWFDEYVMNEIPIRLIRLSDMKFFGRGDVKKHFRGFVPEDGSRWRYSPSDTVKYAILSHRWLGEGEPTFEDMKSAKALKASGPGSEKLKNFCEKAREYNVEFAWSDTCCIDKSSSIELSKRSLDLHQVAPRKGPRTPTTQHCAQRRQRCP